MSELYILPIILQPSEVQFFSTLFHKATVSEVSGGLVRDKVKDFLQYDFIFSLSGINPGACVGDGNSLCPPESPISFCYCLGCFFCLIWLYLCPSLSGSFHLSCRLWLDVIIAWKISSKSLTAQFPFLWFHCPLNICLLVSWPHYSEIISSQVWGPHKPVSA